MNDKNSATTLHYVDEKFN